MKEEWNYITHKQLFLFLVSSQIGSGILSLASNLANELGHDGWISALLSGSMFSILACIILIFLKRYRDKDIFDINILLYSKFVGFILNVAFCIYVLIVSALALRIFCDVIKITTLRLTPPLILTVFIVIPSVYLVSYGLKPICRYSGFVFILYIVVYLFYTLVIKYTRPTFLLPIGEIGITAIIKSIPVTLVSFLGLELVIYIYPCIRDKGKVLKYGLLANYFTTIFYVVNILVLTAFYGENMLKKLSFPMVSLARAYKAPVIERLDVLFIALWFPIMDSSCRKYFYCAYAGLSKVFKIKKSRIFVCVFTAIVIMLSRIPKDLIQVYMYLDFIGKCGLYLILFLCFSFFLSFINKRGVSIEKK